MTTLFLILIAVVVLVSIMLNNISSRIGIPALLAFMLLGMLFGNNGLFKIDLDDYDIVKEICTVALIFIMFYGGFGTRWKSVRPVVRESVLLASAGVVITAFMVGIFCHYCLNMDWLESFLLGAVMGSTDAASVFSILRGKRLGLKNNTAQILEVESGSNDPTAYMIMTIILTIMNGEASGRAIAWNFFAQLAFGIGGGLLIAKIAIRMFRKLEFEGSGYDSLYIFAVAIASYALPALIGGNGYLSAYLVGIIIGNEEFKEKKALVHFFDGITSLMQILVFFLLGLLARPSQLHHAILPALGIFLFMLFVARPAAVFSILTPMRKYPLNQQTLISFVGLRGAASIVFAIMALVDPATLNHDIFNIVFMVVLMSIALQGSLIPWLSKKLHMVNTNEDILKTFNDYSEDSDMNFGHINITEDSNWAGQSVRELNLPKHMLIALVVRNGERILPKGETRLLSGDQVVIITQGFSDSSTELIEKSVPVDSGRVGKTLSEKPLDGIVVLVRRDGKDIIPDGNTVLQAGDRLVIIK